MKILMVSTFHTSVNGGASSAAHRLYRSLRAIHPNTSLLVQSRQGDQDLESFDNPIAQRIARHKLRYRIDTRWPLRVLFQQPSSAWDIAWLPGQVPRKIEQLQPSVVHLHWVHQGFMAIQDIARIKSPLVWTLHDSWTFTGGCHIPYSCLRYRDGCGACPQLQSTNENDMTHWTWMRKQKQWQTLNLTLVAPSRWIADCARQSSLFSQKRIEVIPYGIDLQKYKPADKIAIRRKLGLPTEKKLILFGAVRSTNDPNKGFDSLRNAVLRLKDEGWIERAELVIFGSRGEDMPDLGLPTHYLGFIREEASMSEIYAAVDVFVAPSKQDNLPNTVLEALSCGTPCVAFNIGGMPDMIDHQQNGYLVQPFDTDDLAHGIAWVLDDNDRWQRLSAAARQKIECKFAAELIAQRHLDLYQSVIEQGKGS